MEHLSRDLQLSHVLVFLNYQPWKELENACEVELTFKFFKNTVSAVKINRLCMVAIYRANLRGDIINATVKLASLIIVIKIVVSRV